MSQTNRRAVAREVSRQLYDVDRAPIPSTRQPNGWDEEWVTIIDSALADAERRGLERAAKMVEGERYLGLPNIDATKRTVTVNYVHQWMQSKLTRIAQAIRAQAQADKEG